MSRGIKMMSLTEDVQFSLINFEGIMHAVTLGLFII